ncbi:hypothetical protein ACFYR1_30950 [Streptomyces canus]|uniref:hypothetical protein n=1 Tax=Streptomyces canus TaxID=58343 RepID=UPI00367A8C52
MFADAGLRVIGCTVGSSRVRYVGFVVGARPLPVLIAFPDAGARPGATSSRALPAVAGD